MNRKQKNIYQMVRAEINGYSQMGIDLGRLDLFYRKVRRFIKTRLIENYAASDKAARRRTFKIACCQRDLQIFEQDLVFVKNKKRFKRRNERRIISGQN